MMSISIRSTGERSTHVYTSPGIESGLGIVKESGRVTFCDRIVTKRLEEPK